MQKQAPSVGRILTMVLFALSCFGLLLFLWLSFGGPIPLKPKGYQVKVAFPEASTLGLEADVRISGVTVGKVRKKELAPGGNRTLVTLEIEDQYAPVHTDANTLLRQKTLLGETYVEITPGTPGSPTVPEGGRLPDGQVKEVVQLEEIFGALDPQTRQAFRTWQQDLAEGVAYKGRNRGLDLNDAFGNLPVFVADANDLLEVLNAQGGAVRRLISNTGVTFAALTRREDQLSNLITNSESTFSALASQREALAESFRIFPTFLDESKLTLDRLRVFARDTDPLIRDLRPAVRDLRPTVRDVRLLAPDLRKFFLDLDVLVTVSEKGQPALREILRATKPLLAELGPFLQQLNPILQYIELNQREVSNFFSAGITGVSDTTGSLDPLGRGHYLRQFGVGGAESIAVYGNRLSTNRGNAYVGPALLDSKVLNIKAITPNWDCNNTPTGGDMDPVRPDPPTRPSGQPGCLTQGPIEFQGRRRFFPFPREADYAGR